MIGHQRRSKNIIIIQKYKKTLLLLHINTKIILQKNSYIKKIIIKKIILNENLKIYYKKSFFRHINTFFCQNI